MAGQEIRIGRIVVRVEDPAVSPASAEALVRLALREAAARLGGHEVSGGAVGSAGAQVMLSASAGYPDSAARLGRAVGEAVLAAAGAPRHGGAP